MIFIHVLHFFYNFEGDLTVGKKYLSNLSIMVSQSGVQQSTNRSEMKFRATT